MNRARAVVLILGAALCARAWSAEIGPEGAPEAPAAPHDHTRELRTVEEDVKQLKERVFRSKATLQLLKEIVIEGSGLGARVRLWHVNKMGAAYQLESVQYFLDGRSVFARSADVDGDLAALREVEIHAQTLPPGTHNLQVQMVLRGNGFGVFSYLRSYSFKVQSNYQFKVEDGEVTTLRVVANERSGFARSFVDRPGVQYVETTETYRRE